MTRKIQVDGLSFIFDDGWLVTKFDDWAFYRNQFQKIPGSKAVDIVAIDQDRCVWIIEAKDFRDNRRSKDIDIAEEVAAKVRDSLAVLAAARVNANNSSEKAVACEAMRSVCIRIVFHLEQPATNSKLRPRTFDLAHVKQKLKQLVKAIDPHPLVCGTTCMSTSKWVVEISDDKTETAS